MPVIYVEPAVELSSREPNQWFLPSADVFERGGVQDEVMDALLELGYPPHIFECVAIIFAGESSWRPDVVAKDTGGFSYGLGQRHGPTWGAPPDPWPVKDQVVWFSNYAEERYGGWCRAAEKWLERAEQRGGAGWW